MSTIRNLTLIHFVALYVAIGLVLYFLPFSLFGQDAYIGWGPIISEYLRGDEVFTHSEVTFGGQNLLAIYGFLPFWKLFRQLNFDFIKVENYTLWVFYLLLQYYSCSIYKFFKKKTGLFDFYVLALYTLASPIIINRVYTGHINLLFSFLPSFVLLQIMICRSKSSFAINILTLWFAFSVQGYQLLAYNLFYLPVYAAFFLLYVKERKQVLLHAVVVLVAGAGLAFPAFLQMVSHAYGPENLRGVGVNMVYSYTLMEFEDLLNLIFASLENPFTGHKDLGFFHEITYPMGILVFVFIVSDFPKQLKLTFLGVFVFLILFSADLPPGNWLARLPVISSFRVPQRSLMFFSYLVPLMVLSKVDWDLNLQDLVLPALLLILYIATPWYEAYIFLVLAFLLIYMVLGRRPNLRSTIVLTGLLGLCLGFRDKVMFVQDSYASYKKSERLIKKAIKQFGDDPPMSTYTFHLDGTNKVHLNATAKILGIKTLEGYGHPPKSLLKKVEQYTDQKFYPGQNHLYLDSSQKGFREALKGIGVDYVLRLEARK